MSGAIVPFGPATTSDQMLQPNPESIRAMLFGTPDSYLPFTGRYNLPHQSGDSNYGAWKDIPYANRAYGFAPSAANNTMAMASAVLQQEQRQASAIIAVTGTVVAAAATAMFTTAYMKQPTGPLSTMYIVIAIACGCCTALIGLIGLVRFMS